MKIQAGHCRLNGVPSFIRKITDAGIVCFFVGKNSIHSTGQNCMKTDEFMKKFKYEK